MRSRTEWPHAPAERAGSAPRARAAARPPPHPRDEGQRGTWQARPGRDRHQGREAGCLPWGLRARRPVGPWLCPREPGRDAQTVGVDSRKARSWLEPRPVLYGILLNNKKNIVDAAMSPGSWPRAAPAEAAICRQPRRKLRAGQHQAAAGTACAASRRSPVCGGGTCLGVCVGASPRPPEAAAASTQQASCRESSKIMQGA